MGQKINSLGFRLGTTQSHHSLWYEQPKNYLKGLQEDKNYRIVSRIMYKKNIKISSSAETIVYINIQKRSI